MTLICGLGNPGKKFDGTRHNLGFRIIDQFARKKRFPKFKLSQKYRSLISKKLLNKEKIVLAKPQTFMNDSGKAVKALTRSYKLESKNLIIIHDDIDLPIEEMRIVKNRGAAGHKGVQSIINELSTKDFVRFRIGIKPKSYILNPKSLDKFVLKKFNKEEKEILKKVTKNAVLAIDSMIKNSLEKAMNKFNK